MGITVRALNYFFFRLDFGVWLRAEPATVFEDLADLPDRRIFDATLATFFEVSLPIFSSLMRMCGRFARFRSQTPSTHHIIRLLGVIPAC